jgi:predicted transcriptional regulator
VEDPLVYRDATYEKREWDNIPMVIPRFCIHLSKHLEALVSHCKTRSEEETTADLRSSLLATIQTTMQASNDVQETLQQSVKDINIALQGL